MGDDSVEPHKKPIIFVADVVVLSSTSGSPDILPAPIVSKFPHILLQFGTEMGCSNCPVVELVPKIIASTNKLFFIVYKLGSSSCREWHLVRVAFADRYHCIPPHFRMGAFSWNSMSCTHPMCGTMPQINVTGFSIANKSAYPMAISMHI
jgi:hypothetical protein